MDWFTIAGALTGSSVVGLFSAIFTLRYIRNQEKGKGIQEVAKGSQEVVKISKEEATTFQEWQKVYRDMVEDAEKFKRELIKEFELVKEELQKYKSQCYECDNNKFRK